MRKRSKSIHTSVPSSSEIEEKPTEASDEEVEIQEFDDGSEAEDNGSDGE